jgi:hypothetical protein
MMMLPPNRIAALGCSAGQRTSASLLRAGILIACLAGPLAVWAQDQPLPPAEKILDKYVEVTGGKATYEKITNRVTKGMIEMVGSGIKFDVTIYAAAPNKMYSLLESKELGKIEKGIDGDVVWEMSLMAGPQVKTGDERALVLRSTALDGVANWRKLFKKVECPGVETVDDKPCYKIVLTPAEGEPEVRWYDKESNLLAKTAVTLKLPAGTVPIESYPSDYKPVNGILLAHKVKQVVAGVQQTLIVAEKIEHNVQMPKDRFDLPAEVRALVEKQKSKPAEPGGKEEKQP